MKKLTRDKLKFSSAMFLIYLWLTKKSKHRKTVNWIRMVEPKEPSVYNVSTTLIL